MATQQKVNKVTNKNATNGLNGVGKHPVKIERQSSTGADEGKSAGSEKLGDGTSSSDSPMKQCVNAIEKKLRNLIKRKGKLDEYKKILTTGGTLNADQKEAIAKYDVVEQNLEFTRDLHKQFLQMSVEYDKQAKKQARREAIERHKAESARIKEIMRLLHFLDCMGSDELRSSLCENKNTGLTSENLEQFDEFYKLLSVSEEDNMNSVDKQLTTISSHLVSYLDSQDRPVIGSTYKSLRSLVDRASAHMTSSTTADDGDSGHPGDGQQDNDEAGGKLESVAAVDDGGVQQQLESDIQQQQQLVEVETVSIQASNSLLQQQQNVKMTNSSLPHIDSNSLHNVVNETASQSYPFGMKYQPSDVQGYSFLSNDEMSEVELPLQPPTSIEAQGRMTVQQSTYHYPTTAAYQQTSHAPQQQQPRHT